MNHGEEEEGEEREGEEGEGVLGSVAAVWCATVCCACGGLGCWVSVVLGRMNSTYGSSARMLFIILIRILAMRCGEHCA